MENKNLAAAIYALRQYLPEQHKTVFLPKEGYPDRGNVFKSEWRVPVAFEQHFAQQQLQDIRLHTRRGQKFDGYNPENFILRAPLRVSHASPTLLVMGEDLRTYARHVKMSTFIEARVNTPVASLSGITTVTVQHSHYGAYIEDSLVATSGKFEMFGYTFSDVTEAYRGLTSLLETASIKSRGMNVIPQIQDYSARATTHQLELLFAQLGKARGEVLHLPAPTPKVFVLAIPEIPDFEDDSDEVIPQIPDFDDDELYIP
jgi:hypothetical protein